MAALAGVGGSVVQGANTIANVHEWNVDIGGDAVDVTPFGAASSWRAHLGTVKKWSAKCNCYHDVTDTNGRQILNAGILSTFTMKFYINATNYWSGSGILIAIVPKVTATGVVTLEYSFQGTGPCTLT